MKRYLLLSIILVAGVFSCSKMNDPHQKYLDRGETVYAAKLDSAKAFIKAGSQVLDLYCPKQRVSRGVIYWNQKADSQSFRVPSPVPEVIRVELTGLEQGVYTYTIVTYDSHNNPSLPYEITADVVSQETLDDKIKNLCRSAYYAKYDEILSKMGGGASGELVDVTINSAQNWNGKSAFRWDKGPVPGATVVFTYPNVSGGTSTYTFRGENISAGSWCFDLSDALVEPKNTIQFSYQTFYKVEGSEEIDVMIDLGEEYADRYYHYQDIVTVNINTALELHEDIW